MVTSVSVKRQSIVNKQSGRYPDWPTALLGERSVRLPGFAAALV